MPPVSSDYESRTRVLSRWNVRDDGMMLAATRMSSVAPPPSASRHNDGGPALHSYTLLVFDELVHTPWAVVLQAKDDAKAIAMARTLHPHKRRELWCGDRRVAEIADE